MLTMHSVTQEWEFVIFMFICCSQGITLPYFFYILKVIIYCKPNFYTFFRQNIPIFKATTSMKLLTFILWTYAQILFYTNFFFCIDLFKKTSFFWYIIQDGHYGKQFWSFKHASYVSSLKFKHLPFLRLCTIFFWWNEFFSEF